MYLIGIVALAQRYKVDKLQEILKSSEGKKWEELNLLTPDEIKQVTQELVSKQRHLIERFVTDYLAVYQRLTQQGLLSK
jgi:hypothetical protein